jgi:hypothetical protein
MRHNDALILTSLARRVREASMDEKNNEKRAFWTRHTALKGERPAVFVYPDGSWEEFVPADSLQCRDGYAKSLEYKLRKDLFSHQYIHDDVPIESRIHIHKVFTNSLWGVAPHRRDAVRPGGSWKHEPLIGKPADWDALKMPVVEYDDKATAQRAETTRTYLTAF